MTKSIVAAMMFVVGVACSKAHQNSSTSEVEAGAGIDSLNTRVIQAYRDRDPREYAALYTDTAVFEWPAFDTVRGRAGIEAMVRGGWASIDSMDLKLDVAARRFAPNHATEFGAFQQSFRDPKGAHMIEFGRYVIVFARQPDNSWLIDRFFGFSDSTATRPTNP
jgi:ketosteroid isomerase-like protein